LQFLLISVLFMILALTALAQEEATRPAPVQTVDTAAPVPVSEAPPARVGRLSLVSGNVSVRASTGWLDAELNFPLAAGASVRTGAQGRAEIEIGPETIELAPESEIEFVKLEDRAIQVTAVRGRIGFALRRSGDGDSVEVDVSRECVELRAPGRYDIDAGTGAVAVSTEGAPSDFDDTRLAAPDFISRHMTGIAALDAAGSWESTGEFGAVWVPTGLPADWAPYRDGHWRWIAPWGWTWIDNHPWGFAPSHYGRWAFVGEHWAWVPGDLASDPVYVPAVVAFLGTAGVGLSVADTTGPAIAWFPLAPGEVYWPSYTRDLDYVRKLNRGNIADVGVIQLDANGDPPLEVFDEHFANRRFAGVVPRPVFVSGGAVAPALLSLPEARLENAPVLMGSPQIGPAAHRVAVAAYETARPSHSAWVNHIAALVARNMSRARALQASFAHLHAREPVTRLRGAHLRAPAYAQSARPRHTILLRVAHAAPPPARGGVGKGFPVLNARQWR
jgi:hypothetical protein